MDLPWMIHENNATEGQKAVLACRDKPQEQMRINTCLLLISDESDYIETAADAMVAISLRALTNFIGDGCLYSLFRSFLRLEC